MSDEGEDDEESLEVQVACVGLQVLTLCLLLHPQTFTDLHKDKPWQDFIIDTILICKNRSVSISMSMKYDYMSMLASSCHHVFFIYCRCIRSTAEEQFQYIASRAKPNFFITLLFMCEMVSPFILLCDLVVASYLKMKCCVKW